MSGPDDKINIDRFGDFVANSGNSAITAVAEGSGKTDRGEGNLFLGV
jgi:hypothetical protein